MIETREQMIQLCQISPHSEAQSGATQLLSLLLTKSLPLNFAPE